MKTTFIPLLIVFLMYQFAVGQLVFIYEDNNDSVQVVGTWKSVNYDDCHAGSALYTRKGDGSAWVKWTVDIEYPGMYQIETYFRNYKYGKDTHWTVNTVDSDTTVYVDGYYNPGWQPLGEFNLSTKTYVCVTDYFESDSGDYVYADAIRFTSMMPLYSISGSVELDGENQMADALITLT